MSTGLILDDSSFAVKAETSEGTYIAPTSGSDGFLEVIKGSVDIQPMRALVERNVLSSTLSKHIPRLGMRSVTGKLGVELKGSGVEGTAPDYSLLLESMFGTKRAYTTAAVTRNAVMTSTTLAIEDADIASLNIGDIIVIKKTGAYHSAAIVSKVSTAGSAVVTFTPAAGFTPVYPVAISKFTTYVPADSGHKPFSLSAYWGDGFLEASIGNYVAGMTLQNFKTGQIPSLEFKLDGMSYSRTAATSAPYAASFSSALPAVALGASIYQAGTEILVDDIALSFEQAISFLQATGNVNGRFAGRVGGKRTVKGSFAPYSDTTLGNFTNFDTRATFSMFLRLFNPSATAGQYDLGSHVGIYMPNCILTTDKIADANGVLVEKVEFMATGGPVGALSEIFMGFN